MVCLIFDYKPAAALQVEKNVVKKIILIDPGHGGIDGGAVSKSGTVEKNINLNIGLKLQDKLKANGYEVFLTRDTDKGLYEEKGRIRDKKKQDLAARNKMKEETKCDLFISIHLNMFSQQQYKGAQIWYSRNEESKRIAHIIQDNMRKDLDPNNNRVEKPGLNQYRVLRGDDIPSLIVECGFLSNAEDESKLKTSEYQDNIAESLTKSINEYYRENSKS